MTVNHKRIFWSCCYCIVSFSIFFILNFHKNPKDACTFEILWCSGISFLGIGLGLWNSRTVLAEPGGNADKDGHYIFYFMFVWLIATLSAFIAIGMFVDKNIFRAYAAAALAGITIGFIGDTLPEKFSVSIFKSNN